MRKNFAGSEPLPGMALGRESEEMCLLAKFFNCFANSTRLSILLLLSQRGEMRVGELVDELGAPQPRVSVHLRCLTLYGYVKGRREGRCVGYSIADDRALKMLYLLEEFRGLTIRSPA